jgi:hypothetical protein
LAPLLQILQRERTHATMSQFVVGGKSGLLFFLALAQKSALP